MLEEISSLSNQIGIAFFMLYENPSTLQKAKKYLKLISTQDIKTIISSLQDSEKKFITNSIQINQISKENKNRTNTIIEINNCLSELKDQLKMKQQSEKQKKIKNYERRKFLFDSVKIIVVSTLAILFVISLFSNNQWTEDDDRKVRDYLNKYQQNNKQMNQFTTVSMSIQQEKQHSIKQIQQQKIDIQQSQQAQNYILDGKSYSNSTVIFQNQTQIQNITFSSFDSINDPLVYSYNILLPITSHQVAYFMCSYVLYFIFWAIAIILCVLQVVA